MRVNTYEVAEDGTETLTAENVILSDCYPGEENDAEYWTAFVNLTRQGRYWGGAAPLFLLTLVRS